MTEAKAREIVARAVTFGQSPAYNRADSILTALREAGLAIVPVEATEEMLAAGMSITDMDYADWKSAILGGCSAPIMAAQWAAMLAASQFPSSDQGKRDE